HSGNQHGDLAAGVYRPAAFDPERRQPSPANATDGRGLVDGDQWQPYLGEADSISLVEKIRCPKKKEPPDWVGHELTDGKGPSLAKRQQLKPGYLCSLFGWIAANIIQLRLAEPGLFFRSSINREPCDQPKEANSAGGNEGRSPVIAGRHPRDHQRCYQRAD